MILQCMFLIRISRKNKNSTGKRKRMGKVSPVTVIEVLLLSLSAGVLLQQLISFYKMVHNFNLV